MNPNRRPLAERLRPTSLDEVAGQRQLTAPDAPLRRALEGNHVHSMMLWGPPGVGKTTIARLVAAYWTLPFVQISAVEAGVKDIRQAIDEAEKTGRLVLFIDEIHRFNKAQQDRLLRAVESGTVVLIGATTENPSFEVISALLSRCQLYTLDALAKADLLALLDRAMSDDDLLRSRTIDLRETDALLHASGGDGRKLLNLFELAVAQSPEGQRSVITNELVAKLATQAARYDKSGEQHYDLISAYIKSIRGSDPHAALYWLARMMLGGEDPKFIARRLLILASEDIGNANPNSLLMANTCFEAVAKIGYPECDLILSQTTTFLATSPKSNADYRAIRKAQKLAKRTSNLSVPLHLRNAPTKLMKDLDYGAGYAYPHDFSGNFKAQNYLPEALRGTVIYEPGDRPRERTLAERLKSWWQGWYK